MGKHRKMVLFSPAGTKASEKRILKNYLQQQQSKTIYQ
jgi:hypothetical protein